MVDPEGEYAGAMWDAARREFVEELGLEVPTGPRLDLGTVTQSGGKIVTAFAIAADLDVSASPQQHLRTGMAARIGPACANSPRSTGFSGSPWRPRGPNLTAQVTFLDRLAEHLAL